MNPDRSSGSIRPVAVIRERPLPGTQKSGIIQRLGIEYWGSLNKVHGNMKLLALFAFAFFGGCTSSANAQAVSSDSANAVPVPNTQTKYLMAHNEADQRFITSIERIGSCTLSGPPLRTAQLRVPYQLYPAVSANNHEEGTVKMQLIFDSDWCIRKATIIESTTFWRLDNVSLQWAMKIKWKPEKTLSTADGEPTVTFPIGWGASQGHRR